MNLTKRLGAAIGLAGVLVMWLGALPAAATNYVVLVGNYFFNPTNLTVAQGDTVTWTNRSTFAHDSTQGASNTLPALRLWTSPNIAALNGSYRFTFTNVGVYPYICLQHIATRPEQTGTVSVVGGNFAPTARLTGPAGGSRHPAPPNFVATATATDPDGTVTNVLFTATATAFGTVVVGSDDTPPYSVPVTNLNPASYQMRAVAYDDKGASGTSDVVNVLVAIPAALRLTSPLVSTQNTFQFDLSTTLGMTYVVEEAEAFDGTWRSVFTGVASGSTLKVTRPFETSSPTQRLYRAFIAP